MLVEFKDVVKTYGIGDGMQRAADHINFSIDEGEFVVILGHYVAYRGNGMRYVRGTCQ